MSRIDLVFLSILSYARQIFSENDLNFSNDNSLKSEVEKLFDYKFNPNSKNIETFRKNLNQLDEFQFGDAIKNILNAIVRTNCYQKDKNDNSKTYLSLKIQPKNIRNIPEPIPFAEIFVFNEDFEASHVRNKPISRGGFRWSDRIDYRTEVLGLVKAQTPKNSIIVPSGAKGCFYVKKQIEDKQEYANFGKECYKNFVRGILDLTDNIVNGEIIQPKDTIIYDEKDPYVVVAADKGTATFSDTANQISADYNFWLGDAFASGGSNGYDHKKMGITSRGAYITTKQRFYELGINVENDEITATGVGSMIGDVFGNGMLLFKKMKLIAVFSHMHIFIDPNPDIEKSYYERKRLFESTRGRWDDYNTSTISQGGGLFDRFGAIIKVTPEMRKVLNIPENITEVASEDMPSYILKAKIDMFWNGGIGTFVKSSNQTNQEVKDTFNDRIRVNGNELGCKVFAEGGNVGFTQEGRIEFAKAGGKINMDSIDNSAGVSCSDHEVNIKILFNSINKHDKERDEILTSMTNEVADLVLKDNYIQSKVISTSSLYSNIDTKHYADLVNELEKEKVIGRKLDALPLEDDFLKMIKEDQGISRPQICSILSATKILIKDEIINSEVIKESIFEKYLINYFPKLIQNKYKNEILKHPLRKNIVATILSNEIVNHAGITYLPKMKAITKMNSAEILENYIIISETFRVNKMIDEIFSQDFIIPFEQQAKNFRKIQDLIFNASIYLASISSNLKGFSGKIDEKIKFVLPYIEKSAILLKGSCCSNEKISCCFDAEFTSNLKILRSAGKIFDLIIASDSSLKNFSDFYQKYSKIESTLGILKLRNFIFEIATSKNSSNKIKFLVEKISDDISIIIKNNLNIDERIILKYNKISEITSSENFSFDDLFKFLQ